MGIHDGNGKKKVERFFDYDYIFCCNRFAIFYMNKYYVLLNRLLTYSILTLFKGQITIKCDNKCHLWLL